MKKHSSKLIIESHPPTYSGYPFITLLQYPEYILLTIIDNYSDKCIRAYVLDQCSPNGIDENKFIEIVSDWWENKRDKYPLSIELSKLNMVSEVSKIYKTFNTGFMTRVIGPLPKYTMDDIHSIKRRRKKTSVRSVSNISN